MRLLLCAAVAAVSLGPAMASVASAQQVQLNHLDCRFDETSRSLICPSVQNGRAATNLALPVAQPVAVAAASGTPVKGSAEWNSYCASKYKSFDASTGQYKSFSGEIRPCR